MRRALVAVVVFVSVMTVPPRALGRVSEIWSYERLFKQADLVVIATANLAEKAPDKLNHNPWPVEIVGVNTTFQVGHVLKGKAPGNTLKVLHFKFGEPRGPGPTPIIDGPDFVAFRTRAEARRAEARRADGKGKPLPLPEYMLFLKKGRDGRFEPVSGRIVAQPSVREVYPAGGCHGE